MVSSKETYYKQAQTRLKKIQAKITDLELRIGKAQTGIKTRHDQKMSNIRGQYAQAARKLGELENETQVSWSDLRNGVEDAINALSEAVDAVSQYIKIPPKK